MHAVTDNFHLDVSVTKIDKRELFLLDHTRYEKVLAEHPHLRGVQMGHDDEKLSYQSTLSWEPTISPKFAPGNDCVLAAPEIL